MKRLKNIFSSKKDNSGERKELSNSKKLSSRKTEKGKPKEQSRVSKTSSKSIVSPKLPSNPPRHDYFTPKPSEKSLKSSDFEVNTHGAQDNISTSSTEKETYSPVVDVLWSDNTTESKKISPSKIKELDAKEKPDSLDDKPKLQPLFSSIDNSGAGTSSNQSGRKSLDTGSSPSRHVQRRPSCDNRLVSSRSMNQNLREDLQFKRYLEASLAVKEKKTQVTQEVALKARKRQLTAPPIPKSPAPQVMLQELRTFVAQKWKKPEVRTETKNATSYSHKIEGEGDTAQLLPESRSESATQFSENYSAQLQVNVQPGNVLLHSKKDNERFLHSSVGSLSIDDGSIVSSSSSRIKQKKQHRRTSRRGSNMSSSKKYLPGNESRVSSTTKSKSSKSRKKQPEKPSREGENLEGSADLQEILNMSKLSDSSEWEGESSKHFDNSQSSLRSMTSGARSKRRKKRQASGKTKPDKLPGELDELLNEEDEIRNASKSSHLNSSRGSLMDNSSKGSQMDDSNKSSLIRRQSSQSSLKSASSRKSISSVKKPEAAKRSSTSGRRMSLDSKLQAVSRAGSRSGSVSGRSKSESRPVSERRSRSRSVASRSKSGSRSKSTSQAQTKSKPTSETRSGSQSRSKSRSESESRARSELRPEAKSRTSRSRSRSVSVSSRSSTGSRRDKATSAAESTHQPLSLSGDISPRRPEAANDEPELEPVVSHDLPGAPPAPQGPGKKTQKRFIALRSSRNALDEGSEHSGGNASLGAPSQHSLTSYLPDGMKSTLPKKDLTLRQSQFSTDPHNVGDRSQDQSLLGMPHDEGDGDGSDEFADDGEPSARDKMRRKSISGMVKHLNPMKKKAICEGMDDSDRSAGDEFLHSPSEQSDGSRRSSKSGIMSSMKSMLKKPFKHQTDSSSLNASTGYQDRNSGRDDGSESSIDLFSNGDSSEDREDIAVFKYNASDKSVPQFDPTNANEEMTLHHSCSAVERIQQRRSRRDKRISKAEASRTRRSQKLDRQHISGDKNEQQDELKKSLHSSCSQVDELKEELKKRKARKERLKKHSKSKEREQGNDSDDDRNSAEIGRRSSQRIKEKSVEESPMKDGSGGSKTLITRQKETSTTTPLGSHRARHRSGATPGSSSSRGGHRRRLSLPKQEPRSAPKVPNSLDDEAND